MPHKPFHASIFRSIHATWPVLTAVAAVLAGCESVPKASDPDPVAVPKAQGTDSAQAAKAFDELFVHREAFLAEHPNRLLHFASSRSVLR